MVLSNKTQLQQSNSQVDYWGQSVWNFGYLHWPLWLVKIIVQTLHDWLWYKSSKCPFSVKILVQHANRATLLQWLFEIKFELFMNIKVDLYCCTLQYVTYTQSLHQIIHIRPLKLFSASSFVLVQRCTCQCAKSAYCQNQTPTSCGLTGKGRTWVTASSCCWLMDRTPGKERVNAPSNFHKLNMAFPLLERAHLHDRTHTHTFPLADFPHLGLFKGHSSLTPSAAGTVQPWRRFIRECQGPIFVRYFAWKLGARSTKWSAAAENGRVHLHLQIWQT